MEYHGHRIIVPLPSYVLINDLERRGVEMWRLNRAEGIEDPNRAYIGTPPSPAGYIQSKDNSPLPALVLLLPGSPSDLVRLLQDDYFGYLEPCNQCK